MIISPSAKAAFIAHALSSYPEEAVGIIVAGGYIPLVNEHPIPTKHFRINKETLVKNDVEAVLHSHPYNKFETTKYPVEWASMEDMHNWMGMGSIPWGIVSTEGEGVSNIFWLEDNLEKELMGRQWIHGTQDCYALVRDWFWQNKQIELPNYARSLGWWNKPELGEGMLLDNFRTAGFKTISPDQVKIGDCLLMRYGTRVIGHCGVVTGQNEILHHLWNKLSGHTTIGSVLAQTTHYVRYAPGEIFDKNN